MQCYEVYFKVHQKNWNEDLVGSFLKDSGILFDFSILIKKTANHLSKELKESLFEELLHLYIKVRKISAAKSKEGRQKIISQNLEIYQF